MPAGTSWATFNHARLTGDTKTTQALKALYTALNPALVAALSTTASPFTGLPALFRGALSSLGLSPLELDHIRDWPDADKERVRQAVVTAIGAGDKVEFSWKLHDAPDERTIIRNTAPGVITITFYSPWSKVRPVAPDDVTIDVV
jgi:hypothetical protein